MALEPLAVSAEEAGRALGLSRWHVYRLIDAGVLRKLPHTGRRVLVARAELERFAALGVMTEEAS